MTQHGGIEPQETTDGRTLFYLDRPPAGAGGVSGPATLKQVPTDGGDEIAILERVRFGMWSVTDEGIVFLTLEKDADVLNVMSSATGACDGSVSFRSVCHE